MVLRNRSTKVEFSTKPALLPNCLLSAALLSVVVWSVGLSWCGCLVALFHFLFGFVRLAKMKMCYQMYWAVLSFCFTTNIFSNFPFYQFSSALSNNAFSVVLSGKMVLYLEAKICLFSSGNVISTRFWFLFLHKIMPIVGFSFSCFT